MIMARRFCRSLMTAPIYSLGVSTSTEYIGSMIFGPALRKASLKALRAASLNEISFESTGCILPSYITTRMSRAYDPVSGPSSIFSITPLRIAGMKRASMAPPTIEL